MVRQIILTGATCKWGIICSFKTFTLVSEVALESTGQTYYRKLLESHFQGQAPLETN